MNHLPRWSATVAVLAIGTLVHAQTPTAPPDFEHEWRLAQAEARHAQPIVLGPGERTLGFMAGELDNERIVKGAPYCADALHETVQTLADGNRIVRKQQTRLCRDGEGRTRQEVEHDGRKRIYLRDPVAQENWLLDPQRKTARRLGGAAPFARHDLPGAADAAVWRDYSERMREWARAFSERMRLQPGTPAPAPPAPPVPPVPPAPGAAFAPAAPALGAPQPVVIVAGDSARRLVEAGDPKTSRQVEVQVLRLNRGDDTLPPLPAPGSLLPPGLVSRALPWAPRGPGVVTSLGSQEIEGLRAHGERTTWTIEAGKLGNEKPIVMIREVWTSPDLMLTVRSRDFDPRSGEVSYRLASVHRGDPDPALMKLPPDYDSGRGGRAPPAPGAAPSSR